MDKDSARQLVKETFQGPFSRDSFVYFIQNLLNLHRDQIEDKHPYSGNYIPDAFKKYISTLQRIAKYQDPEDKQIDVLMVRLKKESSLEHARTMQRNFIAWYLNGSRGGKLKDAALVAFVAPNGKDWRFSLVEMEYKLAKTQTGRVRAKEELTPARRYSFLVGVHESSHTAQSRLVPILEDDVNNPTLKQLEESFNIEKVTKEFFGKYRELYLNLKKYLDKFIEDEPSQKIKKEFEVKGIDTTVFCKKLLGQIVFLYFLQKKGWLGAKEKWGDGERKFLRNLFIKCQKNKKNFFNNYLEYLFYDALNNKHRGGSDSSIYPKFSCKIPFLNGGLFNEDYDWRATDIKIENELFSDKKDEDDEGSGILDIFDLYNFTVKEDEPLEKEVAVDPEMLGKVFENLLEVKDRKSKGTYYTPREIVHYMCQESLVNYLEAETNIEKEKLNLLVHFDQFMAQKMPKTKRLKAVAMWKGEVKEIEESLEKIRIVDPACGSGAFLVGMMQEIIGLKKILSLFFKTNNLSNYQLKLKSIQNNLYGVDIDPGAVEIAKLRLWLSLVVDEEDIKQIKPLPNLDYKIVCGNSLLGYPYTPNWIKEVEELKKRFFKETDPKIKQQLKNQIDSKIKNFLANSEKSLGYKVDFDFKVFFSEVFDEKDGFDIVIANPPYVDSETMAKSKGDFRDVYSKIYKSAKGNWDLFIIFIERGLNLLKESAVITYIVPNKLLAARYSSELRSLLLTKDIKELRDFSHVNVFKEADVYPIVFIIKNSKNKNPVVMTRMKSEIEIELSNKIPPDIFYQDLYWGRYFSPSNVLKIILKISNFPSLGALCKEVSDAATVSEAYELKKYIAEDNSKLKGSYKKLINTGTIDRYLALWGRVKTRYIKASYLKPIIFDKNLQSVSLNRYKQACSVKIIIAGMSKELECIYDQGEYLAGKSTTIILKDNLSKDIDLEFLLSILNSKLVSFWYREFFGSLALAGGYLQIKNREIERIPIPKITIFKQKPFIKIVDKILAITKDDDYLENPAKQAKVRDYKKQIDHLVYKLYGLTPEEIRTVEGS